MAHIYDHSSAEAYEDMDETEEEVRLPDDAELKDEDGDRELYVNLDGVVSGSDVTAIYNYMLFGDNSFLDTSDVNHDGEITASDITFLYNIILKE